MSKKLVISEQEKKTIKNMYGLNEQDDMSFLQGLLKKAMELANKDNTSTDTTKDEESSSSEDKMTSDVDITNTGEIDLSNGNFDSIQKENIKLLIDAMKEEGITDPLTQIGVLSVISKESNFFSKYLILFKKYLSSSLT